MAVCDYCQLPLAPAAARARDPAYCCLGCRLAAEITAAARAPGPHAHGRWPGLGLAIFLSLNVMMFTMALWTEDLYDARAAGSGPLAASLADFFAIFASCSACRCYFCWADRSWKASLASRRRAAAAADLLIVAGRVGRVSLLVHFRICAARGTSISKSDAPCW